MFQVQDEMAKEDEGTVDCSSNQNTAERRRSLWYATQYPTDERKVRHRARERGSPFSYPWLYFVVECGV